jgi:ATP-dependent metalloprotease ftsH
VIDDSTQTTEEAERASEERPAPIPTTEPKFNVTQWNK